MNDLDALLNAIDQSEKKQVNFRKFESSEEGKKKLRLLPAIESKGERLPFVSFKVHFINNKQYFCLNQTLVDKDGVTHEATTCPICEMASKLWQKGVEKSRESEECTIAKTLFSKDIYYYRAICREDEDPTIPDVWLIPKGVHDSIIEVLRGKEKGNIFSLKDGRDVIITKKGQKKLSKYMFDTADQSQIFSDSTRIQKVVENMKNVSFSKVVNVSSYDEVKNALDTYLGVGEIKTNTTPIANTSAKTTDQIFAEIPKTSYKEEKTEVESDGQVDIDSLLNSL